MNYFSWLKLLSFEETETISETVWLISCVSEVSLCHAGSTRDSFLPGLPKTIGPNLAQMDTWETSRTRQLPIQTWTFGSSHNDEKKFMLLMRCALTPLSDPEEHTFVQAALCGPSSNMAWPSFF